MARQGTRSLVLAVAGVALAAQAFAFTPPRDGGRLPDAYFDVKGKNPRAFTLQHAWVKRAAQLRARREAQRFTLGDPAAPMPSGLAITGTLKVPVLPGYFSDETIVPVSAADLQNQLFVSNATGTIPQYYSEVSYGQFTIMGDVFSWAHVPNTSTHYPGSCNGVDTGCSFTGEFLEDILNLKDPTVNFANYDNDGPDGIPNSGDDDGFVDVVVFLGSRPGGECGGSNFISHSWVYSAWPNSSGAPYVTNDARTGGGFIQIDDYIIAPAGNCGATPDPITFKYSADEYIDIGVFCHELGHALGLPDLYDANGGGYGIGHWGIMGTGNWNTPAKPAHFDAWCRTELGWVTPTNVGWQPTAVSISDIEENAVAYRLPFTDEKFRRSNACVIAGSYSLYCGLTAAETATRGWASPGPGYGPNWYQTIERDFTYSGTGAVSFQYKYSYELEPNYDYAYAVIDVNGTESQLASYTGTNAGVSNLDLTAYLAPFFGVGGTYTLKFRVVSDLSFDDADGNDPSTCGALSVDDVSVTGGGETYATAFETSVDGWHQDPAETKSSEYWLIENRRKIGFDQNLDGEGLLVWHVDDEVVHAPFLENNGTGGAVRGLVLEEAEGVLDLNGAGANQGEAADAFPGPGNKTSFGSGTSPNSNDNLSRPTQIEITNISAAGATMTATLRAGDPAPLAGSIDPVTIDNDRPATLVTVTGSKIRAGAAFRFVFSGGAAAAPNQTTDPSDMVATSLEWVDENTLRGTVNAYSKAPGLWHLALTNPDGQVVTLDNVLTINSVLAVRLVSADVDILADAVRLRYVLLDREPGETIRLYRSTRSDDGYVAIAENLEPVRDADYVYLDRDVEPGHTYYYLLESRLDGEAREIHRAVAVVPARELVLEQNYPNPFNPRTAIRFYLPARSTVHLDVYDVGGARVRRLADGSFDVGPHVLEWDGNDDSGNPVASGFYVYRLVTEKHSLSRKMMLLK